MNYMMEKYALGYTFVCLPDIQMVTLGQPEKLSAAFTYLANNAGKLGIKIILDVGDLIDTAGSAAEFSLVDQAYDLLDTQNIPYLACTGNHDTDAWNGRGLEAYKVQFPTTRFTSKSWWNGGFCEAGNAENAYCIVDGILYMGLEFGPRQVVIDWANTILTTYSTTKAVIVTHSFLYRDGTREVVGNQYNPHVYYSSDCHDGSEMWDELIRLHDNIIMVICGHDCNLNQSTGTVARRVDNSDGGKKINQILANYQEIPAANGMYMRFYKIIPSNKSINVFTKTLTSSMVDADNQFSVTYS